MGPIENNFVRKIISIGFSNYLRYIIFLLNKYFTIIPMIREYLVANQYNLTKFYNILN